MSPRIARLLVTLHASQWRLRYGREFEALLIETSPTPTNVSDALGSALASRSLFSRLGISALLVAAAVALLLGYARVAPANPQITSSPVTRPVSESWNQAADRLPCHGAFGPNQTC